MMVTSLARPSESSLPVPPRKPDTAALILAQQHARADVAAKSSEEVAAYVSPLAGGQMAVYRDIFRLQATGLNDQADTLIRTLKDKSLMGHVLAQRYLHHSYKAQFAELKDWLESYADHPDADRIAKLASARAPQGQRVDLPESSYTAIRIEELSEPGMAGRIYKPALKRTDDQNADATAMIASIRRSIQIYEPSAALRTFNESKATIFLDDVEKDRVRALIASGYLYAGKMEDAERLSGAAMRSSGAYAPLAGWVHGLTLWRKGERQKSASSFEMAANSPYATGWMVSAASYWASRAHKEAGHNRRAAGFLEKAAANPKTFYGLIATQALGRKIDLNWAAPRLAAADERAIITSTAGLRAERLLAAGEVARAEAEIKSLYIKGDAARKRALLAYAYDRRLPSLTIRLAHALSYDEGAITDAAFYPSMPWTPNQGYRIDRALMHAIARQESRFNALAENKRSGATGLMQMMPATAVHVSRAEIYQANEGRGLLKTPEISLDLGQKYVEELLNSAQVGQDLFSLAIAYNAGPGTLAKWKAERADINDPLLFIETIPYAETRTYVERVMANYWIYRMKFDQPNDSMVALAEGKWARYAAYDKGALKFADAR